MLTGCDKTLTAVWCHFAPATCTFSDHVHCIIDSRVSLQNPIPHVMFTANIYSSL